MKPVVIITSDGGPDENPRYKKVIEQAVAHFKKHDLDAFFLITNAPGRSAFNRVERRMAPLSRELSGIVFPHDEYGSHLDDQGRTVDEELQLKNIEFAGKTLAKVWSEMDIDKYPVLAEFVDADAVAETPEPVTSKWYNNHVKESQYFLQVWGHFYKIMHSIFP